MFVSSEPIHLSNASASCHGCSLCLLSCPMWLQKRDVRFSPQGFAKALQHGANANDISEELSACIACGACDLLCPEKIDLTAMIADLLDGKKSLSNPDVFAMLEDSTLLENLNADDVYIIDAAIFHANYDKRVGFYDGLRQSTGCSMNLDLNRMAIATGIDSLAAKKQRFDVKEQIEYLLHGRKFNRIVVENKNDQAVLAEVASTPVVHVSELIAS